MQQDIPENGRVKLTACDREPVHLISAVQSHGAVLVFDADSGHLAQASDNWREMLRLESHAGAGRLEQIFGPVISTKLNRVTATDRSAVLRGVGDLGYELSAHRRDGSLVVEVEGRNGALRHDVLTSVVSILEEVGQAQAVGEYLQNLSDLLRANIGIDHVMVYRFLPDWTGEVVAESRTSRSPSYLGLRYPSTDIPKPARDIFQKVWVRHIADIDSPQVSLRDLSGAPSRLDLSLVSIRASSPIHLEYLANMGVRASLTLSLRVDGRLWGLVACHHQTGYRLMPSDRSSLEVLAQMASLQLSALIDDQTASERARCEELLVEVERKLQENGDAELASGLEELASCVNSDAVAVYQDGAWQTTASLTPDSLDNLLAWIRSESGGSVEVFCHNELPPDIVPGFAGVLACAATQSQARVVCWLRREQAQTVNWAGNPTKDLTPEGRLNPRRSFTLYIERTKGKSLDWTNLDLWKAGKVKQLLSSLAIRLQLHTEQKNLALSRSNRELDSFAFMASHDLKEPLRGIANYATFLKEDYGELLQAGDGLMFVDGLVSLSHRMTMLVDSLLTYSRLDHQQLVLEDCDLGEFAREAAALIENTRSAHVFVPPSLPVVRAYPPFLREILLNLMTNAVKYSRDEDRKVEVGTLPGSDRFETFYVRDNGIGIPLAFRKEIFNLFRRLHPDDHGSEGSGVGLTIVRRMTERHGGEVWVESEVDVGSTFYVSLPKGQVDPIVAP